MLELRNIGPAFNDGRIADIDFHSDTENIWYVAVGSLNSDGFPVAPLTITQRNVKLQP